MQQMFGHQGHGDENDENGTFMFDTSGVIALSSRSFEGAGDGSSFVFGRPSTGLLLQQDQRINISCLNDLHNAFATNMMEMPSRLQIFEVIDEWMVHLERALNLRRDVDAEVPDDVHQRLQLILKKEYETWDLIKTLYFDRLNVKEDEAEPFDKTIYDKFHLDERSYAQAIVRGDKSLQEMEAIIAWLELNYSRNPDPDLTQKHIAWEQTLETLKRDELLGRSKGTSMVTMIDPDAVTREERQLHTLDAEEELRIQRGTFHYLRTGSEEKAIAFLTESGHIAKAFSLLGCCMSQADIFRKEEEDMEDGFVVVPARSIPASSEYPPESKLQPRPKPNFTVDGNTARDLWKSIAWKICESKGLNKWERAIIGVGCRHGESMLEVAKTWEDKLWSYLKASVDVKIEEKLRNLNAACNHMKLPSEYWSQGLSIDNIFEKLDTNEDTEFTINNFFQLLQKCVMTNNVQMFLDNVHGNIESIFGGFDDSFILDHIVRFLTHVLLTFAIVELPYNEEITNLMCEAFIRVLVRSNQFVSIPFYVQKLSFQVQIPVVISQINCEKEYCSEEINAFLKSAAENELDVLGIGVAVVEKMRDEVSSFNIDCLQWISLCYPYVEQHNHVMYQFLRYTVSISRKYLTLGDLERVKPMINQITSECIGEVINLSKDFEDTVVREFLCYREYLEAEDELVKWKKAISQQPNSEDLQVSKGGSLADRVLLEKKKRDYEVLRTKWSKAVDFHARAAIEKFMGILKFPGGWLRSCSDPSDEDESVHIHSVRRIIIKKVTYILLNLIKERRSAQFFREFVHVLCENHRNIIEEFSPTEIGSIFKVVEEFSRVTSPNLMELPK